MAGPAGGQDRRWRGVRGQVSEVRVRGQGLVAGGDCGEDSEEIQVQSRGEGGGEGGDQPGPLGRLAGGLDLAGPGALRHHRGRRRDVSSLVQSYCQHVEQIRRQVYPAPEYSTVQYSTVQYCTVQYSTRLVNINN